jgi:hypothetical protein
MLRVTVILALACWECSVWGGQPVTSPEKSSAPSETRPDQAKPGASLAPPLPGTKTEADTFRELLSMSPAQRAQALQGRTDAQRKYLEASLREYEALEPEEREARLQQIELNCRLPALMRAPPGQRAQKLEAVPPYLRPIVDERLRQFDLLPPETQRQVLEYETTANYFMRPNAALQRAHPEGASSLATLTGASPGKDPKAAHDVREFFGMDEKDREKTLRVLPTAEREEIAETLAQFAKLPPVQRAICIASFEKLSRMTKEQRFQFLKNSERWSAMSPRERETWKTLVKTLPPGPDTPVFPPPPPGEGVQARPVATNVPATN